MVCYFSVFSVSHSEFWSIGSGVFAPNKKKVYFTSLLMIYPSDRLNRPNTQWKPVFYCLVNMLSCTFGDSAEALVSVFPTSAVCCACPLVFPGSINAVIQRGMRRCGISDTSLPELDAQPLASHAEPGKVR